MWKLLLGISILLSVLNYSPGTYLSGWDTLHPEFNFAEYFKRILGVWQAHQGLGAVASQAHAAELPRILMLYPLSFIVPDSFLRYLYMFAALSLGPLGVYFFIKKFFNLKENFAFLGGLFYLLNLVTVQQFIVPFEMFATQFAALPWLFLLATRALEETNKRNLILFVITSFLSAPMAHTPTLWYAYFLALAVFLAVYSFKNERIVRLNSIKVLAIALLINSFWILPNMYFSINHASDVVNSKIHTLFTEEAFAQNASFGNLEDFALFRNFLFNWSVYAGGNRFEPLLSAWTSHLGNPLVTLLGYGLFLISIAGAFHSVKNRIKAAVPLFSVLLLSAFFLLNINPPLGFVFSFLQDNIPYFKEAIRFPFTKFSIIFIFAVSIYFAFGAKFLTDKLKRLNYANLLITVFAALALIFYTLPAFKGELISPYMRVHIPQEYFALFDYFKDKPMGRIANFPVHSFWGWTHHEWNGARNASSPASEADRRGQNEIYQGAGFTWFGLKQPLLDREFDRWQPYNEQYQREVSYALYTKNAQALKAIFSKYDISYVLIDKSVVAPSQDLKILYNEELQNLLSEIGAKKERDFGSFITVYNISSESESYVLKDVQLVSPGAISYEDFAYQELGNYLSDQKGFKFPFRDIADNQSRISKNLGLSQEGIFINIPEGALEIPSFTEVEKLFAVDLVVEKNGNVLRTSFIPRFPKSDAPMILDVNLPAGDRNFLLSINKIDSFTLNNLSENTPLTLGTVFLKTQEENTVSLYRDRNDVSLEPNFAGIPLDIKPCRQGQNGGTFGFTPSGNGFTLTGEGSLACLTIPLQSFRANFTGNLGLLGVSFTSSNPSFCLADLRSGSCKNYDLRNITLNPVTLSRTNSFFEIQGSDFDNLGIKFILDAREGAKTVSFKDVSFSFKRPVAGTSFLKEITESLKSFRLEDDLIIPFSGEEALSLDITKLPKTDGDCPVNKPGLSAPPRKSVIEKEFENYIRYEAEEGSYCDHFSYRNLPLDQAYLIAVKSRNIKGLPVRLCVTNLSSGRCDIYAHLSRAKDFTVDLFLLPPMEKTNGEAGFDININNFAVKNIGAVNDIASIQIIPFPYTWLSNIKTLGSDERSSVLVLSQAYEPGWKAFDGTPFLGGKELKDHVVVNGWANGWVLESGQEGDYTFVFVPQYLLYLGFILSFGTMVYIIRRLRDA